MHEVYLRRRHPAYHELHQVYKVGLLLTAFSVAWILSTIFLSLQKHLKVTIYQLI
jgi:hypothetical protein